ncbi:VWA domain-containing protein [Aquimarina spongiae]|uniref:von Willebrand factor type A domain-containing protein n=1 Tax=Aquimarina spongiae TaxID=570521 RepID=A0A1M6BD21_9FLAO|nr:VWA domain-containing protein [Aquimarina spongiae]SHI46632.1 von Willebrand factor type A domain-containing protein [Aquimarina spongiae]
MKKVIRILSVFLIISTFQSCYVVKKSDQFFGIETSTKNTLYLIDISGSMEGIDEGSIKDQVMREAGNKAGSAVSNAIGGKIGSILGKQVTKQATKLGAVKRKLIPAIKGLPDGKKFAVFAYNNDVTKQSVELRLASNMSRTSANIFVENLKAGGGTNTAGGLVEAISTPGVQEIVLMSDGLPNGGPEVVLEEIRKVNTNNIIIHTIAFGEDADHNFMRTLAQENNGIFITSKM